MLALIDADIVAFRCACSAEKDPVDVALYRVDELMRRILHETDASEYKAFLTGSHNFRYEIYPEYKANRRNKPKPVHLDICKEHLITQWNASVSDGNEADDLLGIEQTYANLKQQRSIIASIDKDLLQIPGNHFNFVKGITNYVDDGTGLRSFYRQLIQGDGGDNIQSFDGRLRNSVPKFIEKLCEPLNEMTEEKEMYEHCLSLYEDKDIMHRNASLLYIQRVEGDKWQVPGVTGGSTDSL